MLGVFSFEYSDTELCLGWDNCHRFSDEESELDAVGADLPSPLKLSRTIADFVESWQCRPKFTEE
jgi:hypothetical protein